MKKSKKCVLLWAILWILLFSSVSFAAENQEVAETSTLAVKKGLIKEADGKYYYYYKGKPLRNRWKTIKGKRYYFGKTGKAAIGAAKINGVWRIFNAEGQLVKTGKNTMVKIGKTTYYADGRGRALTG